MRHLGFVNPTETPLLYAKTITLLAINDIPIKSDKLALIRMLNLRRCFTIAERDLIDAVYSEQQRWQARQAVRKRKTKKKLRQ